MPEIIDPMIYVICIISAALAVAGFFVSWFLIAAAVLIIFIILAFAHDIDKHFNESQKEKMRLLNAISSKLDAFHSKLDETKEDLAKRMFALQSRQQALHGQQTEEMERDFRELAGKMLQIENSLSRLKKFLQYEEQL